MTLIQAADSNVYWYGCEETGFFTILGMANPITILENCLSVLKLNIFLSFDIFIIYLDNHLRNETYLD